MFSCGPTEVDLLARNMKQPGTAGIKRQASTACTPELGMLGLSLRMSMRGDNAEQFADGNVNTLRRANTVKTIVVANDARPLDMISFLGPMQTNISQNEIFMECVRTHD